MKSSTTSLPIAEREPNFGAAGQVAEIRKDWLTKAIQKIASLAPHRNVFHGKVILIEPLQNIADHVGVVGAGQAAVGSDDDHQRILRSQNAVSEADEG